jgi:hypothetical protein
MTSTNATLGIYNLTVFIPLVSAAVSAVVSAIVAGAISYVTLRHHRRQYLDDMIDKMVALAITYPYLEDESFCRSWVEADKTDEKVQRYDNYCCFVFNLIESIWKFCRKNEKKIDEILYVKEMAVRHQAWWKSNPDNLTGYAVGFHAYIENQLKAERKGKGPNKVPEDAVPKLGDPQH